MQEREPVLCNRHPWNQKAKELLQKMPDESMETQAVYKASSQQTDLDKVLEKINEIARESAIGDYIYHGEPAHHKEHPYCGRVNSGFYRQYLDIAAEHFDVAVVQYERKVDRKARR